jgi:hypothetical protein
MNNINTFLQLMQQLRRQFFHVRSTTISGNIDTGKPVTIKGIE